MCDAFAVSWQLVTPLLRPQRSGRGFTLNVNQNFENPTSAYVIWLTKSSKYLSGPQELVP